MADIAELTRLIEPEVEAEGLSLVRVQLIGGTSDPTIQVMAERPDTRQMTIEDCERLHRRIAEAHDQLSDDYRLEISSPTKLQAIRLRASNSSHRPSSAGTSPSSSSAAGRSRFSMPRTSR